MNEIRKMVDKETLAWNTKDVSLLISLFHPDMVWPFPAHDNTHHPQDWIFNLLIFYNTLWSYSSSKGF